MELKSKFDNQILYMISKPDGQDCYYLQKGTAISNILFTPFRRPVLSGLKQQLI